MAKNLQAGLRQSIKASRKAGVTGAGIFSLAPLDLRFALLKTLDPRVTFTRASTGTYVGSDGVLQTAAIDVPRFDHNPTTGESLGLLAEEARTNLLLRSEEFNDASWIKQSSVSVSANTTIAPNGTLTADTITWTSASVNTGIYAQILSALAASVAHTRSIYVRADSAGGTVQLTDPTLTIGITTINLTTEWQRIQLTENTTIAGSAGVWIRKTASSPNTIYLWGAQLEAGAFATSYIPTTTATATRAADVASVTGTNFSPWYNQTEGTVFVSATTNARHGGSNSFPRILSVSDGTNNNQMETYYRVLSSYTDAGYGVVSAGTTQAAFDTNDNRNGQSIAIGYASNNFPLAIGGTVVATDTSGTVPTVSRLGLGVRGGGGTLLNGTIKRLTYWPVRLGNNVLQQITQ